MQPYLKSAARIAVCFIIWHTVPALAVTSPDSYLDAQWEDLMPESWNPEKVFEGLDIDNLPDDDPRMEKAYEAFLAELEKAPINENMQGRRIKIAGFVAPLDWENSSNLKEFLLVPYFGACIHLPPPPLNQIIYIKPKKPLKGIRSMEAVRVYGTMSLEKKDSGSMGASGYSMQIDKVEPYKE